jgi:hypothetical protein
MVDSHYSLILRRLPQNTTKKDIIDLMESGIIK